MEGYFQKYVWNAFWSNYSGSGLQRACIVYWCMKLRQCTKEEQWIRLSEFQTYMHVKRKKKNTHLSERASSSSSSLTRLAEQQHPHLCLQQYNSVQECSTWLRSGFGPQGQNQRNHVHSEDQKEDWCDLFECPSCGLSKSKYTQLQTRSGDEAMTTFILCYCGYRWKED